MATYDDLMVDIGNAPDDDQGDPLRTAFDKINQRFAELRVFLNNRGDWAPNTAYTADPNRDWVIVDGVGYLATSNHTSGATFAADLAAGKWVEADALLAIAEVDTLRDDLASTSQDKGADMVAGTEKELADYVALRAYAGSKTRVYITGALGAAKPAGIAGVFQHDPSDTTSADNGGTVIVGTDGRRWKRDFSGFVNVQWFGADPSGQADSTASGTAAISTGKSVYWPSGAYKVSPVTTGRPHSEPNRTSAWVLSNNQTMFGDGAASRLLWGTPATRQCFFKAANCSNVALKNLRFDGGYSSIIVDPTADGSVNGVLIEGCYFENLLIDVLGGNQLAIDSTSKFAKNITVRGCKTAGPTVHSVLFTNCYNAQAIGNSFNNVAGGFCVDASQGSRNVVIANNTADTCQYFCKVESSDSGAVNPTKFASHEVVIANNTAINVTFTGIFLNSAADHIAITGNVMVGFSTYGIFLDQASGFTHNGSVTVSGNVLSAAPASTDATGIRDSLTGGALPHVFANNVIDEVLQGIHIARKTAVITGGSISADSSCLLFSVSAVLDGIVVSGVKMTGASGINCDGTGQPVKRLTVTGCDIRFTSIGIYSQSAISQSVFSGNNINSAAPTLAGFLLESPANCSIQDNTINMNTSTLSSIFTATATTDCIITGNITNRPFTITAPSANTVTTGNITGATYVS